MIGCGLRSMKSSLRLVFGLYPLAPVIQQDADTREPAARRFDATHAADAERLSESLLQISDQVGTICRARQTRIGHPVGWDGRLRIGDKGVHRLRCPGDTAALERR